MIGIKQTLNDFMNFPLSETTQKSQDRLSLLNCLSLQTMLSIVLRFKKKILPPCCIHHRMQVVYVAYCNNHLVVCSAIHLSISLPRSTFLAGIVQHTTSPLIEIPNVALWILTRLHFVETRTLYTVFAGWYQHRPSPFSETIFFEFFRKKYFTVKKHVLTFILCSFYLLVNRSQIQQDTSVAYKDSIHSTVQLDNLLDMVFHTYTYERKYGFMTNLYHYVLMNI